MPSASIRSWPVMGMIVDRGGELLEVSEPWIEACAADEESWAGSRVEDHLATGGGPLDLGQLSLADSLSCRDVPCFLRRRRGSELPVLLSALAEPLEPDGDLRYLIFLQDDRERARRERVQRVLAAIAEAIGRKTELRDLLSHIQEEIGRLMDARNFYVALVHDRDAGTFTLPYIDDENPEEILPPEVLIDLSGGFTEKVVQTGKPLLLELPMAQAMANRGEIELLGKEAASWLGAPLRSLDGQVFGVVAVQSYRDPQAYGDDEMEVLSIISSTIASAVSAARAEQERKALIERLGRSQKMEALGRLAGGVAHDLNNVLSAIVGYPELLREELPVDSPLLEPLDAIRESGEKAAAIVEDLLALARRGVSVKEAVDLNEVVRSYLGSPESRRLLDHHPRVRIECDLGQERLMLEGSAVHLTKTLMNLVANAAEAMPEGGTLRISTDSALTPPARHDADARSPAPGSVVLRVEDEGVGIGPHEIEKIFEPFYTKKVMGRSGTGLGMAVVWGTVEDHGGSIEIESEEGQGTVFEVRFPSTRAPKTTRPEKTEVTDLLGNEELVLVVDDREAQRAIAARILRRLRYRVEAVASGEEAVDFVRERPVDLVVLDMVMDPGIDGLETLEALRDLRPAIKAIIVSGYSESDRIEQALRLGVASYLKKPYTMERLGVAVKTGLADPEASSKRSHLRRDSGSVAKESLEAARREPQEG